MREKLKIAAIVILFTFFILISVGEPLQAQVYQQQLQVKTGFASWYAEFSPGIKKTTANMEIFDDSQLTCAIWDLPFGTIIKVTNLENGKSVFVRVNDRGPAKRLVREGRIIDLTMAAFAQIADLEQGLVLVQIEIIESTDILED